MKILQILSFKVVANGPTSVIIPIIQRLKEKGHTVDVFTALPYNVEVEEKILSLGAKYYYKKHKLYLKYSELLEDIPEIETYDMVHIHGVFNLNQIFIAKLLKTVKIPYIVSIHGNLMEEALKHSKIKKKVALELLIKNMLLNATLIHALSKEEQKNIEKVVKFNKIRVIHNGVESINNVKKSREKGNEKFNILFIGRVDINHKGLDLLINAIETRKESWKDKVEFNIVGPFDTKSDEKYISDKLDQDEVLKRIIKIEGPKYGSEKYWYYETCDLFIHTSRYEGMPMAVLEAMQFGVPCLVTPETNMSDIMKQSKGGFVVDLDTNDIAKVIDEIIVLENDSLVEIGKSAQLWSIEHLGWDIIAIQYEKMYSTVIYEKS